MARKGGPTRPTEKKRFLKQDHSLGDLVEGGAAARISEEVRRVMVLRKGKRCWIWQTMGTKEQPAREVSKADTELR